MQTLLALLGAVALLVWGVRTVRTALERAFPSQLERALGKVAGNRFSALLFGVGTAAALQSGTAVVTMVSGFVSRGKLAVALGLAAALGSDVGSAVAAVVLSQDVSALSPFLIMVGVAVFMITSSKTHRNLGRFALGLGFVLLALSLISGATQELKSSETVGLILTALGEDLALAVLMGAVLTVATYSSLATVLLVASFAAQGLIGIEAGFALVLGVNLASGAPALIASWGEGWEGRVTPLANLVLRMAGAVALAPFARQLARLVGELGLPAETSVVLFHLSFNALLVLVCLPFVETICKGVARVRPMEPVTDQTDARAPIYLREADLERPERALANCSREVLRAAEAVHQMLNDTIEAFRDKRLIRVIRQRDEIVDSLHREVILFVAMITRERLTAEQAARAGAIFEFSTNLEHIGDIVDHNLMDLAGNRKLAEEEFSPEGWAEILRLHEELVGNFKLALDVFLTEDGELAEQLLIEKRRYRERVEESNRQHFQRLNEGRVESMNTSVLHLDILRDFRRINSHLSTAAYPVLEPRRGS
ncbi:Na/Pi cotransporter family protein [Pelagibius litoralis]|uniref:Na/Pi cotransporter family protein n=1 Tax=Pelagibius litoralis TaxID=374515 RepID=A0A967EXQ4_9PROT|nr:Na/Pi cotransporter family protein [Pelagibius litoralis]NIA69348.1 Na/Pi cotransporter family protein [Pelagibius litoralis]